jgi:hypothetical protein
MDEYQKKEVKKFAFCNCIKTGWLDDGEQSGDRN